MEKSSIFLPRNWRSIVVQSNTGFSYINKCEIPIEECPFGKYSYPDCRRCAHHESGINFIKGILANDKPPRGRQTIDLSAVWNVDSENRDEITKSVLPKDLPIFHSSDCFSVSRGYGAGRVYLLNLLWFQGNLIEYVKNMDAYRLAGIPEGEIKKVFLEASRRAGEMYWGCSLFFFATGPQIPQNQQSRDEWVRKCTEQITSIREELRERYPKNLDEMT